MSVVYSADHILKGGRLKGILVIDRDFPPGKFIKNGDRQIIKLKIDIFNCYFTLTLGYYFGL